MPPWNAPSITWTPALYHNRIAPYLRAGLSVLLDYPDTALWDLHYLPFGPRDARPLDTPLCHDSAHSSSQRTRDFTAKQAAGTPLSVPSLRHWLNRCTGYAFKRTTDGCTQH